MVTTYDSKQINASHLCWLCCRREVYATHARYGCIACRLSPLGKPMESARERPVDPFEEFIAKPVMN